MAVERAIITFNGNSFYLDSIDKEAQRTIADIKIVEDEIQRLQTSINIVSVAKNFYMGKLVIASEKFEKVITK